jgi:lipoprotein-anchoring transpeptidase ErfK/SrfK
MKSLVLSALALSVCSFAGAAVMIPDPLPKAPEPVEDILRLQIFLDSQLFGPGKVDGRPGDITSVALKRYQQANGLPETEVVDHSLDLASVGESYTTYTIREEDLKFVGDLPSKPSAQSKKKYLPYDSVLEFLTERFHCSPELLEFINQPLKMHSLKVGDVVKVPNVEPFLIEELVQIGRLPEVPEFLARVIKIDTRKKILGVWDGDKLLASLPITPGSGHLATPPGTWKIVGIAQMPTFRWDESVLNYGVRSEVFYELPMGPNNPVGVMWIGLNRPGIGIHGTNSPQTIGRSSSHGCMRTANWDVVRLVKLISKGMTVVIEGPEPERRAPEPVVVRQAEPVIPVATPEPRRQISSGSGRGSSQGRQIPCSFNGPLFFGAGHWMQKFAARYESLLREVRAVVRVSLG